MQSSLIGKIEKAKRYAQEKDRVTFSALSAKFRGENDEYSVSYRDGKWRCTCRFFSQWGLCSHTMAMEQILRDMLPEEALSNKFDLPAPE
jgi:hypothetical protein